MKIDVLGAEYTLTVIRGSKEPRLKDCDGFCDETTKEMLVENYESGLAENSNWAQNEEMVDFFAIQFPKLLKAFEQADAL